MAIIPRRTITIDSAISVAKMIESNQIQTSRKKEPIRTIKMVIRDHMVIIMIIIIINKKLWEPGPEQKEQL